MTLYYVTVLISILHLKQFKFKTCYFKTETCKVPAFFFLHQKDSLVSPSSGTKFHVHLFFSKAWSTLKGKVDLKYATPAMLIT